MNPDDRAAVPPPPDAGLDPTDAGLDPTDAGLDPTDDPTTTGTLFLVLVILMIIAAVWVIMYLRLLDR